LARIILSHALLESIRFVMSRKECRYIYGLINIALATGAPRRQLRRVALPRNPKSCHIGR
jgi:hypothetical protein